MTPSENLTTRIGNLITAEEILDQEGLITETFRRKINQRIADLVASNPGEAAKIIRERISSQRTETSKEIDEVSEPTKPKTPEMPADLWRSLSKNESTLLSVLLTNYGQQVAPQVLVSEIFGEELQTGIPDSENKQAQKLRSLAHSARKKIQGWGKINSRPNLGYWLEIESEVQPE